MPCRAGTPLLRGTWVPCSVRPGCARCVPRLSSCHAAQATARPSMTSSACEPRSWWRCPQTQRCPRTQHCCCRSGALWGSVPSTVLPASLAGERDVVVPWRGWEGRGRDSGVTPCAWAHMCAHVCAHGSWPHTVLLLFLTGLSTTTGRASCANCFPGPSTHPVSSCRKTSTMTCTRRKVGWCHG